MARITVRTMFAWESEYYDMVLENDDVRLAERMETLEGTLLLRLLDLSGDLEDKEELMAVEEGLRALALLKKDRGIA